MPSLLEEVIGCRDDIAQEYLMEVIVQVFSDEFHLNTLELFLGTIKNLESTVNLKQLIITLIDKFAGYAKRLKESKQDMADLPQDLFVIFYEKIDALLIDRSDFELKDSVGLLGALIGLSVNCYPHKIQNVDIVLGLCKKLLEKDSKELCVDAVKAFQELLLIPLKAYKDNLLLFLQFESSSIKSINGKDSGTLGGFYVDVLFMQPFSTRELISKTFLHAALQAGINQS